MKFVSWNRGSAIELEAEPELLGRQAEGRQGQSSRSSATARPARKPSRPDDLDIIQSPLAPQDIKRLQEDKRFGAVVQPGLGVTYINFNTKDPLLSSPKMRQAFSMLIDQKTIVNDIYPGRRRRSPLRSSCLRLGPIRSDIKQPGFNIEGAKKLFKDEGWADTNGDGILDKGGKPLSDHACPRIAKTATASRQSSSCRRSSKPPASTPRRRSATGRPSPPTMCRSPSIRSPCSAG